MLNIINGILFVQISQQDIENFKMEYEKRQKESDKSGSGDSSSKNNTENSAEDENDKNAKSSSSNSQSRDNSEEKNELEKSMPVFGSESNGKDSIENTISEITGTV